MIDLDSEIWVLAQLIIKKYRTVQVFDNAALFHSLGGTLSVAELCSGFFATSLFNKCRETLETFNFQLLRGYGQLRLGRLTSARFTVCKHITDFGLF